MMVYIHVVHFVVCLIFVRTLGGADPPNSSHWPLLYSPHLEIYSIFSRIPSGVERGRRLDMHPQFTCVGKTNTPATTVIYNDSTTTSLNNKKIPWYTVVEKRFQTSFKINTWQFQDVSSQHCQTQQITCECVQKLTKKSIIHHMIKLIFSSPASSRSCPKTFFHHCT